MTNKEIRVALKALNKFLTTQDHVIANHVTDLDNLGVQTQSNATTPTSRILYFTRIYPLTFHDTIMMNICMA